MECVYETVTLHPKHGLRTECFALSTDLPPPDCPLESRMILIKIEYSNLDSSTDSTFMKKLVETVPENESENRFQLGVGNCVVGTVVTTGECVESVQGI